MTSLARLAVVLSTPVLLLACAQGAPPLGGDGTTKTDAGSGKSGGNAYGGGDNGGGSDGGSSSGSKKDGGAATPIGGGTDAGSGGGTGGGGTGGGGGGGGSSATGDCTGSDSSYTGDTYENACEAYYDNTGDDLGNPCTSGGGECDSLSASEGIDFCCFSPKSSSTCNAIYGAPQCVPQ